MAKKNPRTKPVTPPLKIADIPPAAPGTWKDHFRHTVMREHLTLKLSPAQMEYLCAVAEDVVWDRSRLSTVGTDTRLATEDSLVRRGFIERKAGKELTQIKFVDIWHDAPSLSKLTPLGEAFVNMLKVGGVFIHSQGAAARARAARRKA